MTKCKNSCLLYKAVPRHELKKESLQSRPDMFARNGAVDLVFHVSISFMYSLPTFFDT